MRGTRVGDVLGGRGNGIIPAYAGNTSVNYPQRRNARDHPRVCGEHHVKHALFVGPLGSSPRMRGTLKSHGRIVRLGGIIPAYAGNTMITGHWSCYNRDHPRVCGEHPFVLLAWLMLLGSSPRMRGTQHVPPETSASSGIIPAYAGNTA